MIDTHSKHLYVKKCLLFGAEKKFRVPEIPERDEQ